MTATLSLRRASGFAAFYLAAALVAAMVYFLVGTDMPSVTDPTEQVQLLIDHQLGLHVMYLIAYVVFGLALVVLALGLRERLDGERALSRVATVIGLIWAGVLAASGMVFIMGMNSVVDLHASDPDAAVAAWRAIYPVTLGLGGAAGEVLGGTWVLLVCIAALRLHALPFWLTGLGIAAGVAGLVSTVPGLAVLSALFGLLAMVWFVGVGVALLRTPGRVVSDVRDEPLVSASR